MNKINKMHGVEVTEEEAAKGLGFANVNELRRRQTEIGRENAELKHKLYNLKNEACGFRYNLVRTLKILAETVPMLEDMLEGLDKTNNPETRQLLKKLLLGINVVSGKQVSEHAATVDWDHILNDWLEPINERLRAKEFDMKGY